MDAYEGQTVRLHPLCPLCNSAMTDGFLLDHTHGGYATTVWVEGAPKRSIWLGVNISHTRRYAVSTFRCDACGFLASYATTPTSDG